MMDDKTARRRLSSLMNSIDGRIRAYTRYPSDMIVEMDKEFLEMYETLVAWVAERREWMAKNEVK